ncbi:hypothetical protein A3F27_00750 [Candidatus Kaiserbacteria bacterium RIFCSPHIGHO2_12_FULL_53_13]|uniref:Pilus assembly protein PilO n=1 Tax=Candidatus Kaiserbacteria bacterium RIFCSPHIGHO2_12_FULL_53_13 TaxID=1798502 RepID=A0A1F6E863_9BACT|nr:MAG: hypothetical protein A3F27_00750 [Candidatus Kaiserbacteria bacterium RIFCSPHIGHO2_12_FULL_53_13]
MIRSILSIIGLIVAGGIFFIYTQPAYSNVQVLQQQMDQYDQALDKTTELQKLKQSLLVRYNAFNPADLDRLHKLLPDHVDNVRLILDLDNLAGNFGMALQNVIISSPASENADKTIIGSITAGKQRYDSLTLRFSTRSTYANFVKFMEDLESSLRIVDIVSLSVAPEASSAKTSQGAQGAISSEPYYRYDIAIRTYWLK